jgi:hypothetical protein
VSEIDIAPSQMELEHRLEWLLPKLQSKIDEHYTRHGVSAIVLGKTFLSESAPPVLTVNKGRTYWKLVKESRSDFGGNSRTVYGFVRISDGAIFRAATWRQPETRTKGAIRGYIMDEYCEQYFTQWGVIYDL